ncbi:hypothetical protein ABH899_001577 [Paenibacillus sp. RC84]
MNSTGSKDVSHNNPHQASKAGRPGLKLTGRLLSCKDREH